MNLRAAHLLEDSQETVVVQLHAEALSHDPEVLCANLHQTQGCEKGTEQLG